VDINHLHLKVSSVARSKAFYARHFGLTEHVWHGDMVFMRDRAGMDLALAPAAEPERMPDWFHFGFRLESVAAVEALHDELAAAGVPMVEPLAREPDLISFRCSDPDGYAIEVYWEPQPA
jgi:catechol 2,3-dioxygenase-like lactoylglutathione lyase family enzyme